MIEKVLQIKNLSTHFYTTNGILKAVDEIDLEIGELEAIGFVGESGCGKTVTALSIMRLVPIPGKIVKGQILLGGKNITKLSEEDMRDIRGKEVSMVFQDPMTFMNPVLRVGDQLDEVIMKHQNISKKEAEKIGVEMFTKVGIPSPEKIYRYYPHQLSGGMNQRCLIAMALLCNPALLIADEPTTALDVTIQAQIMELIKNLIRERQLSLMLITHDLGLVAEICDRIYVMYAGKIVEKGDIYSVYENPKHPYTKGLLESVLSIDEFKSELVTIKGSVPNLLNPPPGCRFHPRCPLVKKTCREQEPIFMEVDPGHFVACHHCI